MTNKSIALAFANNVSLLNNVTAVDEAQLSFVPNLFDICFLLVAFFIFVTGIVGNALVIFVVLKNSHMKTVTNIFIVNLAIGDFLVNLICLPPSILNDVMGTWLFGETMCKLIIYVQVNK